MQRIFQALSDEGRRRILDLLREQPLSAGELSEHLPFGKPALSHHLAILKAAELVRCERVGQRRVYSLNTSAMEDLAAWVFDLTAEKRAKRPRGKALSRSTS